MQNPFPLFIMLCAAVASWAIPDPCSKKGGCFSVSDTDTIQFALGNLQYKASTGTWRFAEQQYDYVGDGNTNTSSTYDGWIDLFGWGTSGYNNKYPYMTSAAETAYGDGEKDITATNYDWGKFNPIGTDTAGTWRLLTREEWTYLCETRSGATELMGQATVNGIKGFIFLPDDWIWPPDLSFKAGTNVGFAANTYTLTQWTPMEDAGAVFLPAAGYRNQTTLNNVQEYGFYSSSSYYSNRNSYNFSFATTRIDSHGNGHRNFGLSVRLVRPYVKMPGCERFTLTVMTEQPDYGTASGSDMDIPAGETSIISATPKDGCYMFTGWSDGNTDNPREVIVTEDATYTAIFEKQTFTIRVETDNKEQGEATGKKIK